MITRRLVFLGGTLVLIGCGGHESLLDPLTQPIWDGRTRGIAASAGVGAIPVLTGSGHHTRVVGGVAALTTFSFNAIVHSDGSVSGHYEYNFRAAGFAVTGPVTCVTTAGNQAWVGGVVEDVRTDNPAFESLLGLEMWWRSKDGGSVAPDSTTGLGFGFPGGTITAESWCRDQPTALIIREVENGNLQVR